MARDWSIIKKFYITEYLNPNSDYNRFKTGGAGVGEKAASYTGPFENLTAQQKTNLQANMKRWKLYKPTIDRIKRMGYITGEELGELTGIKDMRTKAKELMYPPKAYKRQKNIFGKFFKKDLKARYFDIGQGGFGEGTLFYKKPTAEQLTTMKEYFGREGAKYGITTDVQKRVKLLHNNPSLRSYIRKGAIIPDKIIKEYMTLNQGAHATLRIAQIYDGHKFANVDLGIAPNKKAAEKLFTSFEGFPFQNPYRVALYNAAMETLTKDLGKNYFDMGKNLDNLKRDAVRILKREGLPIYNSKAKLPYGLNLNEITGITASSRTKTAPYSQFVNLMEGKLNQTDYGRFLKTFEKEQKNLAAEVAKGKSGNPSEVINRYRKYTRSFLERLKDLKGGPAAAQQLRELGMPDLTLKDPQAVYGAKRLSQLEAQGLDLMKSYKDVGYTVKVPKGSVTLKEFIKEPKVLIDRINSIPTLKKIVENRVGCADGCLAVVAKNEPGKITRVLETLPQKARGFLSLLGKGGARAAPLAALAGVGAVIEPLVRPFVVDDPTTYLTDESQMKGMLLSTIEGETPKVDQEILKWQYPGLAGATVAGAVPGAREAYLDRLTGRGPAGPAGTKLPATIPNKPVGKVRAALGIKGVLGKALGASFSPLAAAATLPIGIAAQRKAGTEWGDIATDPGHWMAPAFASAGAEMATRGMQPTGILAKAIRMGMSPRTLSLISRRFGFPGLAVSAGMWGYDKWKNRSINDED